MQYKQKECRQNAGLSQMETALHMETTQHQISKWETGKQDITLSKAIILADLYKVTLDQLAGRNFGTMEQTEENFCSKKNDVDKGK